MDLDLDGVSLEDDAVSSALLQRWVAKLPPTRAPAHSIRGLLSIPAVHDFAASIGRDLTGLGENARAVRGILFDKPAGANWGVPWHQDRVVSVCERKDVPGFSGWTMKAGVAHVDAPRSVLESMVALRIHLDDVGESDGPLQVLRGTHRDVLAPEAIAEASRTIPSTMICGKAGSVLRMKPLLVHSSRSAALPSRRRILHLEFSADDLPGGLSWRPC